MTRNQIYYNLHKERLLALAKERFTRKQLGLGPVPVDSPLRVKQPFERINKAKAVELLGGACEECGYNKCLAALHFDHDEPKKKKFNIARLFGGGKEKQELLRTELFKCTLLCANCHAEKTTAKGEWGKGTRQKT
jgi:hypothetical protein